MAQVPYSPVADVSSQLPPTPSIHVDTPLAAFGGNVAEAVSKLGATSDQVGNEIFARANSMQQLHNEATAREAGTQYMQQSGQMIADFTSRMGKDASPDALMKFNQDLADLRVKLRQGVDNPAAQSMFDSDTYNYMGRDMRTAALHSSQQLKAYAIGTNKAQIAQINDNVLSRPDDEAAYTAGRDQAVAAARDNAIADGKGDADVDFAGKQAGSSVTFSRIAGIAKTRPIVAQALMDKAVKDGTLTGQDSLRLDDFVTKQLYSTGSKTIADETRSGTNLAMGQGIVPIERAKDAIAMGIESGGNYSARGPVLKNGDQGLGKYMVMQSNLQSFLRQSGVDPMTPDQFIADHGAQEKVFEVIFGGAMQKYGNFNDAASVWFTGRPYAQAAAAGAHDVNINVQGYLGKVNARLAQTASAGERVAAVRGQAAQVAPDKPLLQDYAESNLLTRDHQDKSIAQEDDRTNWNTIDGALISKPGQPAPTSIDDLKKDPEVAQAIAKLDQAGLLKLQNKIKIAASQDDTSSPQRTSNFQKINGMGYSGDPKFLDIDPYAQDLTRTERQTILQMQKKMMGGGKLDDPQLRSAMSSPNVKAALHAAGADYSKDSPEEYYKFQGALQTEINQARSSGKPLSYQDTEQMALRLLQDSVSDSFFGASTDKMYRATPQTEDVARIRSLYPNRTLSDEDVQRLYAHGLFVASQRKTVKPVAPAPAQVPRSE